MTTIIIDGESKKVFSDSRGTHNEIKPFLFFKGLPKTYESGVVKIFRVGKYIITGCGQYDDLLTVRDWMAGDISKLPVRFKSYNSMIYVVSLDGDKIKIMKLTNEKRLFRQKIIAYEKFVNQQEWLIDGSGSNFAKGAFSMNANPMEAIEVAAIHDDYTDKNVVWMEIPDDDR